MSLCIKCRNNDICKFTENLTEVETKINEMKRDEDVPDVFKITIKCEYYKDIDSKPPYIHHRHDF